MNAAGGREHPDDDHGQLDAYLDGRLPADDHAAFAARLADEPGLAGAAALQRRMDGSLRGLFVAPPFPGVPSNGHPGPAHRPAEAAAAAAAAVGFVPGLLRRLQLDGVRWEALFGGLLATGAIVVAAISLYAEFGPRPVAAAPLQTFESVYRLTADPSGACGMEDGAALEIVSGRSVGRTLRLKSVPAGVEVLGANEASVMSTRTALLRTRVHGAAVVVFAVPAAGGCSVTCAGADLNVFRRELADVVLYEMTPLDAPAVLDHYELSPAPPARRATSQTAPSENGA